MHSTYPARLICVSHSKYASQNSILNFKIIDKGIMKHDKLIVYKRYSHFTTNSQGTGQIARMCSLICMFVVCILYIKQIST